MASDSQAEFVKRDKASEDDQVPTIRAGAALVHPIQNSRVLEAPEDLYRPNHHSHLGCLRLQGGKPMQAFKHHLRKSNLIPPPAQRLTFTTSLMLGTAGDGSTIIRP